ncbi:MAG TPA: TraR/DksA C4-type zinc finger protein [Candidatus Dormibacteraeota bacterium]|jgi:RNA polymerase-binding protein DksA
MERARQLLLAERERLLALREATARLVGEDVEATAAELSHADQHPADEATELFEEERDLGVEHDVDHLIAEVDAALQRVDEGRYGICEACGKPIPDERLEAVPAARYCVEDQARRERGLLG